jgi:hypothetical protein
MRGDALASFLDQADASWDLVDRLLSNGQLIQTRYGEHSFYVRKLARPAGS